ncbi:MAG: thiaminase II [Lentisphaerae bacterium]|jgi:thiaminase/transcriptional activator TenA|nr:thiaminase II [Lentisphaerota bacterium]
MTEQHTDFAGNIEALPFVALCLDKASTAWNASFNHPFVRGIIDGSLSPDKFRFYQMQDARYLEAYAAASSLVAVRCTTPDDMLWFIDSARIALVTERSLHTNYGLKFGYDATTIANLELTLNNRAYQDHIIAVAQRGSMVEAVAALTPCPWLYIAIGRALLAELGSVPATHPYADWLHMYSDPHFDTYISELLTRLQRYSDEADDSARQRAVKAFVVGIRYEWLFWEQAWQLQTWPV